MRHEKNEGALDIKETDVHNASPKNQAHQTNEPESDELAKLNALRERARRHSDGFIVKTDLEDQDERDASPGTREQD